MNTIGEGNFKPLSKTVEATCPPPKIKHGISVFYVTDSRTLIPMIDKLWNIIDDIDTADDMFKEDDKAFREYVMNKQKERHQVLFSDGYGLYLHK